jgi:16S rRNA (cytidine1402-2'-O)-methyltransferase
MPIVSDPGFPLVREVRARGVQIEVIPGPFAGIMALAASGIAPLPFTFFGFTPHRAGERREFYRRIAETGHTAIVYESPERLFESLDDALSILGDTEATVAREMTKIHEEYVSGTIAEVIDTLRERGNAIRGEITIVFGAARKDTSQVSPEIVKAEFERLRSEGMRRNDAVKTVAEKFGMRKNDVYRLLL